jgi:hypothetical protein
MATLYTGSSTVEHSPEAQAGGEVGCSNRSPCSKFGFSWAEELMCQTGPYVRRWVLRTPWFSVRLHHWLHSDDARAMHDHPSWFITLVLRGGYTDSTPTGNETMLPGMIRFRPALHRHTVQVHPGGCWTLLLFGPEKRRWGFWVGKKWKKSNKYFFEHGKHVCD